MNEPLQAIKPQVSKNFLIDIITRDIELREAILELVDNSIDSAIRTYNINVIDVFLHKKKRKDILEENLQIKININESRLIVEDNCGGITRDDLRTKVFMFGKENDDPHNGLSAFGIGMKRAFFKIGRLVKIKTKASVNDSSFIIWDINEWSKKSDWEIEFSESETGTLNYNYKLPGTIIEISLLNDNIKRRFSEKSFLNEVKKKLSATYALFIKDGIQIYFNDELIDYEMPEILESENVGYINTFREYDEVKVQYIMGVTNKEDEKPRGWYIFCNGRMILEADKTPMTGWGESGRSQFHPKFNHFVGFVLFTSSEVLKLPWSTTKQGIERDSTIYRKALNEMYPLAKPYLEFLDRWRGNQDDDYTPPKLEEILAGNKQASIFEAIGSKDNSQPKLTKERSTKTKISFEKDKDLVLAVKRSLGNEKMSNVEMGEQIFNYFYINEVEI